MATLFPETLGVKILPNSVSNNLSGFSWKQTNNQREISETPKTNFLDQYLTLLSQEEIGNLKEQTKKVYLEAIRKQLTDLLLKNLTTVKDRQQIPLVIDAFKFAYEKHETQQWGGKPYFTHILAVFESLINRFDCYSPTLLIASLLHDVLEDQYAEIIEKQILLPIDFYDQSLANITRNFTLAKLYLKGRFTPEAVEIIEWVTKTPEMFEHKGSLKVESYRKHTFEAFKNPEVFVVKVLDLIANTRDIGTRKVEGALKYLPVIEKAIEIIQDEKNTYLDKYISPEGRNWATMQLETALGNGREVISNSKKLLKLEQ